MKQQTWIVSENLKPGSNVDYINKCCELCDAVLEKIKSDIAEKFRLEPGSIVIGQEDWGWYLEFQKGEIVYLLSISYQEQDASDAHNFGVVIEAQKLEKGLIFKQKVEAPKEADDFARSIEMIARQHNFQVLDD